jgi:hypothetical protein
VEAKILRQGRIGLETRNEGCCRREERTMREGKKDIEGRKEGRKDVDRRKDIRVLKE